MVDDTHSRLPSASLDYYQPSMVKAQCCANELFTIGREENNEDCLPLKLLNVQIEQHKYLRKINYKLSTYILDRESSYSKQSLEKIEII